MNCPLCNKRHNKYPISCIRTVQNRYGYYLLRGSVIPYDIKILHDKITEYDKLWNK